MGHGTAPTALRMEGGTDLLAKRVTRERLSLAAMRKVRNLLLHLFFCILWILKYYMCQQFCIFILGLPSEDSHQRKQHKHTKSCIMNNSWWVIMLKVSDCWLLKISSLISVILYMKRAYFVIDAELFFDAVIFIFVFCYSNFH